MPCNCNVRVRATPPSAQAESQTVVQRLRQQAGRSRQAARQAAPACSRPFELVGTLTARFPLTCRDGARPTGGRKQGCERCRIPQKRTKENAVASIASIPKENAVGAPDKKGGEGYRFGCVPAPLAVLVWVDSCRELPQGVVALKSSSDTSSRSIAAAFFDFFMSVSVSAPCRAPHAAVRAPGGAPQAQPSRARPPRACASRCPLQPPTSGIGSEIPIINQRKDVISVRREIVSEGYRI